MADPQTLKTDARRHHDPEVRGFASDNYAGAHPEVLAALAVANGGHQTSYGEDAYTEHLQRIMHSHFGPTAEAFPVFNGTGSNVTALQALTDRWGAVICAESAHIHTDEGGAPERMGGLKLLTVPTPDGKLTPELIDRQAYGWDDEHRAMPQVVSITQNTELGTVYTPAEIRAICEHAHERGMKVHLDGARIANAAASLNVPMRTFTNAVGVDVLSFGGTKNGMLFGEAVVVLNPDAVSHMKHLRKMSMQLASKMRFVSVQLEALLAGDLWLRSARHANTMAQRLAAGVRAVDGVEILYPVQANAVFARLPHHVSERLQKRFRFYFWNEAAGDVRWMCSFDTTEDDVDAFVQALKEEMAKHQLHNYVADRKVIDFRSATSLGSAGMELIQQNPELSAYLKADEVIDHEHPLVRETAARLHVEGADAYAYAKAAFEFVRDTIPHSSDVGDMRVTWRASDVLEQRTGICCAKAHVLTALLRAQNIPTALCYQRLNFVHGLVAVKLPGQDGWARQDPRGNKPGVDAQFSLDGERLAFRVEPESSEVDYQVLYAAPHPAVVRALQASPDLETLWLHLPTEL